MDKGFVYYVLVGKCRKFATNTDQTRTTANMHVVVRFKNEARAEKSQLGNGFHDVEEHFQAGLPFGWYMDLDEFGIECHDTISEEEANKRGFIIKFERFYCTILATFPHNSLWI